MHSYNLLPPTATKTCRCGTRPSRWWRRGSAPERQQPTFLSAPSWTARCRGCGASPRALGAPLRSNAACLVCALCWWMMCAWGRDGYNSQCCHCLVHGLRWCTPFLVPSWCHRRYAPSRLQGAAADAGCGGERGRRDHHAARLHAGGCCSHPSSIGGRVVGAAGVGLPFGWPPQCGCRHGMHALRCPARSKLDAAPALPPPGCNPASPRLALSNNRLCSARWRSCSSRGPSPTRGTTPSSTRWAGLGAGTAYQCSGCTHGVQNSRLGACSACSPDQPGSQCFCLNIARTPPHHLHTTLPCRPPRRRAWRSSRRCCTPGTPGCCASSTSSSPSSEEQQPRCWAPATAAASPWVRVHRWEQAAKELGACRSSACARTQHHRVLYPSCTHL